MSEKGPRKFSLGDIIRKLNEHQGAPAPDSSSSSHEPTGSPDSQAPAQNKPSPPPDTGLPAQPAFGSGAQSKNRHPAPSPPDKPAQSKPHDRGTPAEASEPAPPEQPAQKGPPITTDAQEPALDPSISASSAQYDPEEEEEFDVFRYVSILLRRKVPILVVAVLATLYSLFTYLTSPRVYIAKARLLFRPGQEEIITDNSQAWRYWANREKVFNTHLELLKSRIVLDRVSEALGGEPASGALKGGLTIQRGESGGEKNDIIELRFRHGDAETARDAVNTLSKTYIEYRREVNAQEYTRLIFKLKTQIDKLQAELTEKEDALRAFKESNRMVQLSKETNLVVSKLSNMELALQQTQLDLVETKERLESLKTQISKQESNVVQSMTYDNAYQNRLADLQLQLSTLSAEYSPEHFKVRTIRQQIDTLKEAMKSDIQSKAARQTTFVKNPIRQSLLQELVQLTIEKAALETKRSAHEQIIDRLNRELLKLPSMEQRYAYLQRETESLIQTLRLLKSKHEEAKIQRDAQASDLKILELAQTPTSAISTVKVRNVLVGAFVGLVLGIALAFLLEYLDQTIKDPGDVEKILEMPLIGIVPLIETEKAILESTREITKSIMEPFRAVRANLKHLAQQHKLRSLIVCSAVKGEGKTTLAANLAITFAMDGKRVILVDGDLRRSQMHKLFDLPKEKGIADYLQGTLTADEILKPTSFPSLFIVTSGEQPHNPAELVGTTRFEQLVHDLRQKADLVLFDSPALLPVSDVITMAPKIDGVVMVIRTLWTPAKAAKQARNQLQRIGCSIYGSILNGVSRSKGYYPYYYGYYGYYSYKYAYEYDDEPRRKPSLRELGLRIENGAKGFLRNIRLYLPHYVALAGGFGRYCIRRPLFWLMLLLLAGLSVLEVRLRPSESAPPSEEGIRYVAAPNEAESTRRPGNKAPAPEAGVSLEALGTQAPGTYREGTVADSSPPLEEAEVEEGPFEADEISELAHGWVEAYNKRDVPSLVSYYDSARFSFPGGGIEQWRNRLEEMMLSAEQKHSILLLDTVRIEKADPPHCKVSVLVTEQSAADTARSRFVMIWRQTGQQWHILRQKRRNE